MRIGEDTGIKGGGPTVSDQLSNVADDILGGTKGMKNFGEGTRRKARRLP